MLKRKDSMFDQTRVSAEESMIEAILDIMPYVLLWLVGFSFIMFLVWWGSLGAPTIPEMQSDFTEWFNELTS